MPPKKSTAKAPATKAAAGSPTNTDQKTKAKTTSKKAAPTKKAAATKAASKKTDKVEKVDKAAPRAKPAAKPVAKDPEVASEEEDKAMVDDSTASKSKKRKADDAEPEADREPVAEEPKPKKAKTEVAPARAIAAAKPKKAPVSADIGKKINDAPTQILDIYVFGEGTSGELGLGSRKVNGKKPIDVKRPRLNDNLSAKSVGIVDISCGGMHAIALTRDNQILSWGVNDQGALGRDTTWDGGLRDASKEEDSDSEDDDDDTGMNPRESTPTAISDEHFLPGTKFVKLAASDSASFALTADGRVYGWGTFRSSDGILGFTEKIKVQTTPKLLTGLKNVQALAAGANHILALDIKGNVVAWGCGQQNQLGRRIIERNKLSSLIPQGVGLPRGKITKIACGAYHSFAVDKNGDVWGWGLNNFGEIGVDYNVGEDDAVILKPAKLTFLEGRTITGIEGGMHHSVACTDKGKLLTWGRVDGYQVGFEKEQIEKLEQEYVIKDDRGATRILVKPTVHENLSNVIAVAAGMDNNFAITGDGKVYSWGFSTNYQTGQGTIDDIHTPTVIDNTATRGKKMIGAFAGGQFSILIGEAEMEPATNGVAVNGIN